MLKCLKLDIRWGKIMCCCMGGCRLVCALGNWLVGGEGVGMVRR